MSKLHRFFYAAATLAVAGMPVAADALVLSRSMAQRTDFIIAAKQPKCSAGTVESYEGTDMSGVTDKCLAIFDACVNEKLPCKTRLEKCKTFDKMDGDGSCYKKKK